MRSQNNTHEVAVTHPTQINNQSWLSVYFRRSNALHYSFFFFYTTFISPGDFFALLKGLSMATEEYYGWIAIFFHFCSRRRQITKTPVLKQIYPYKTDSQRSSGIKKVSKWPVNEHRKGEPKASISLLPQQLYLIFDIFEPGSIHLACLTASNTRISVKENKFSRSAQCI